MRAECVARLAQYRHWADAELAQLFVDRQVPERLAQALRYTLEGPGKRLRPALVRLACEAYGGNVHAARQPAIAIECVHTYSLVHDDLPCMDDDDLRRGRPTCHKVFGEALAVLVGDALLTEAFACIAREPRAGDLAWVLAQSSGARGMVGGQVLDLESGAQGLSRELVRAIHLHKTAALIGAAMELGAIAAGATQTSQSAARQFGIALGEAFQATDDVLDVTAPTARLGKTAGKDAKAGKPSLVAALGLAEAQKEAQRLASVAREAAAALPGGSDGLFGALAEHLLDREA